MGRLLALLAIGQVLIACAGDPQGKEPPPAVRLQLDEPADGATLSSRSVMVRGTVEAEQRLARISYQVNGREQRSNLPLANTFEMEITLALAQGENRIEIVATDVAGNEGRISRTVESHAVAPTIDSFVASASEARPGGPVELSWSVSGDAPLAFELEGIGTVEGNSVRVHPAMDTTYRLKARNAHGTAFGSVDVKVIPELVPQLQTVFAGELQRLRVAGAEGPFEYEASGGSIRTTEGGWTFWEVPEEPGSYEIRVQVAGGEAFVHPVEVRAPATVDATWSGRGGQPSLGVHASAVAAQGGALWAAGRGGVLYKQADAPWTMRNDGLDFSVETVAISPDGAPWVLGSHWNGEDIRCAIASWDPVSSRWIRDDGRVWAAGSRCSGPLFRPDGSQVVAERGSGFIPTLWTRPGRGAEWTTLPSPPRGVGLRLVGPDGTLYGSCPDGCLEPGNVFRLPAGGQTWESLGESIGYPTHLALDPDGALVAFGVGLARLSDDGTWEDMTAGLPAACRMSGSCWVEGLVFQDGKWLALTDQGLFARDHAGEFALVAELPAIEAEAYELRWLFADGSGDLWIAGGAGLWRLPAGGTTFHFVGDAGLPGRYLSISALAIADDGKVAVGTADHSLPPQPPAVAIRDAGSQIWRPAGPSERVDRDGPDSLLFDDDGSLLVWSIARFFRIAPDGSYEELPTDGIPQDPYGSYLCREADGAFVTVPAFDQPFRLEPGATSWTALPEVENVNGVVVAPDGSLWATTYGGDGIPRLAPDASTWEIVGSGPFGAPWTPWFRDIQWAPDGTAWAFTSEGIARLEEGVWRHVGGGVCGWYAQDLLVTGSGRILCATGDSVFLFDESAALWTPLAGQGPGLYADLFAESPAGTIWLGSDAGLWEVELP